MKAQQDTLFYADIQVGGRYPEYRLKKYERQGIKLDDRPQDYELLAEYSADFLSFFYYSSSVITTHPNDDEAKGKQSSENKFFKILTIDKRGYKLEKTDKSRNKSGYL